jgi:hypothetical protein
LIGGVVMLQEILEENIEGYISLYLSGIPLKNIKPLEDDTYKILSRGTVDIRIINRDISYNKILPLKKIHHFTKDFTYRDKDTGIKHKIKDGKYFYMIPIQSVKGTIVGFILRTVFGKKDYASVYKSTSDTVKKVPFMFGFYKDFMNYGKKSMNMPIVVCEGVKDCIALKTIYPYTLSNNTSKLGFNKHILKNITNKVILVYDNDATGESSLITDRYGLEQLGIQVSTFKLDDGVKDVAEYLTESVGVRNNFCRRLKRTIKRLSEV